ncbi:DUF6398 domain-containing protein [Mastigocoleus testarum]|uniref:Uncharacterized protein n=1 Tax=Mastigocoleus testarum BC008 TaxID=371196 RepID=A0A0V7ZZ59_9CYAN|nr:DUF6398 domain-containing protein [Mastigocoleus testarum]KST61822.1 hypothetical protein BC008_07190 [Mastigocoleus testarum BC008]KST69615.1 hypothetical protein BC008_04750 [Mastigocoleus testarum BC008]
MAKTKKSENVPKAMQEKFNGIVAITDDFAKQHLNDEYAQIIRFAAAALCRKRPSPLVKGREKTWACGITHAIGMVNFLFDSSQDPHISAKEIYKWFGVSSSTGQSKSKQVRDILNIRQMDPNWCLPSKLDKNPMAWMISIDGFIIDARSAPREIQEVAYAQGFIPYIPGNGESKDIDESETSPEQLNKAVNSSPNALYVLDVFLIDGPVTEEFIAENPVVSRTIEIKGSNTLEDLHKIIFKAFDRTDEHMYEFQVGGRGPQDPNARRYCLKQAFSSCGFREAPAGDVSSTSIASLGLSMDEAFGYWFDFGDDWWHQIDVTNIADKAKSGKYPRITKRLGVSPPQYADFE